MGMNNLGALHSRPIVQLTGTNPYIGNNVSGQDIDSLPLAVASYWGAIADSSFFYGNNKAPVIMFHGDNDIVVSHQCARPFSNVVLAAPATCGSEVMFAALQGQSIDSKLFIESGQGHEYWGALNGSWLPSGPNAFWKNIIDSTISFYYHYAQPQIPVKATVGALPMPPLSVITKAVFKFRCNLTATQQNQKFKYPLLVQMILKVNSK
jgi:hypothetical protein